MKHAAPGAGGLETEERGQGGKLVELPREGEVADGGDVRRGRAVVRALEEAEHTEGEARRDGEEFLRAPCSSSRLVA